MTAIELAIEAIWPRAATVRSSASSRRWWPSEPLREKLQAQQMLALYRSGRQAEALDAYRQARAALVDAIGVEPGPELRRLTRRSCARTRGSSRRAERVELPPELYAGTPLAGARPISTGCASTGGARTAAPAGSCCSRARAASARRGSRPSSPPRCTATARPVLYASGAGAPAAARTAFERAGAARRPTLLVLDDVTAPRRCVQRSAELVDGLAALPVLVLATAEDAGPTAALGATRPLTLAPLDADGVAAVARLYAGGGCGDRRSSGWSRRAAACRSRSTGRRALGAHGGAARRLDAAAGRAAAERAGLRAAEDDAGRQRRRAAGGARARELGRAPTASWSARSRAWPRFEVEDARVLLRSRAARRRDGRAARRLAADGDRRAVRQRQVVGAAGRAAARARRRRAARQRGAGRFALLRPGEHPLRALEHAVAAAPPRGRLVLAVDQFEEVFTACRDEAERTAFADALVASARDPRRRALVLVAVRADFYGRCAAYPELWRLLGANQVPSGRCAATSCGARSSCPPVAPACRSSPSWPTR